MNATFPTQTRASTQPVIAVSGLSKTFSQGGLFSKRQVRALDNVDLELWRGEILAIVGQSGSGKSTIARILARLERPNAGTITVDGVDILEKEPLRASRRYRKKVQMVFQDPFGSLNPVHPISHFIERPLLIHGRITDSRERWNRMRELMATVGLTEEMLQVYPYQLSGGQRQRVAVARALAAEPEVILADEPTSMLDVSIRIGLLNLMKKLRDERGISMLYITHDLASARYIADRTIVMHRGRLVEGGDSIELMANPVHPYTRRLIAAVPDAHRKRASVLEPVEIEADVDGPTERIEISAHHWVMNPSTTPGPTEAGK